MRRLNFFFIGLLLLASHVAFAQSGFVAHITDGDTVYFQTGESCPKHQRNKKCWYGKKQLVIRLAEIDAPESDQEGGKASTDALKAMIDQQTVSIKVTDTDAYGRTIAHIYHGDKWINAEMVKSGHAWVYRHFSKSKELLELEREAKREQRGLWTSPDPIKPWEWRRMHR